MQTEEYSFYKEVREICASFGPFESKDQERVAFSSAMMQAALRREKEKKCGLLGRFKL